MNFIQFHNFLIVFFIIFNFYKHIYINGHLVSEIVPEHYKLFFDFDGDDDCLIKKCVYHGRVIITMKVSGRVNSFVIHSDPQTIIYRDKVQLNRIYPNGTKVEMRISDYIYTTGDISTIIEIQVAQLLHMLSKAQFELIIYFSRQYNDQQGFYNNNNDNAHNNSILMITHMIPNRAHRFFPCLHSQYKWLSSFETKLLHPSNYNVVTGMTLIENEKISPTKNMSTYNTTKKMPSDHLFFVIWRYVEELKGPLKFWFPQNVNDDFIVMADYAIKSLKQMSNITNTIAPIYPTMNIAPVLNSRMIDYYIAPGISLFKQHKVLYDNKESSSVNRLEILTFVARAVASHWIGILVYPQIQANKWIYRALSYYVADFLIDSIEPLFRNSELSFARTILWTRSDRDLEASTTIPFYLFDTWDDKMYFRREDYTTYQATAIIAMIHEIYDYKDVGALMVQGLQHWENKKFGPTEHELLNFLQKPNVNKLISDWSLMPGIPIIHVVLDRSEETAELVQERFNPSGPWSDNEFAWTIPIRCYNNITNGFYFEWIYPNTTLISNPDHIKSCILYTDSVVPYRVNYPEKWWLEIIEILLNNPQELSEMRRMRIIDDLLELCLAGYMEMNILFKLLSYLSNEIDYLPWLAGGKVFSKIRGILWTGKISDQKINYQQLVKDLVFTVYEYFEKPIVYEENPKYYLHMHKKNIMNIACGFGHEKCLENAETRMKCYIHEMSSDNCRNGRCFDRWSKCMDDGDEREMFICHGLRRATIQTWTSVLNLLHNTELFPPVRLSIARGLACTENTNILENYIYYVLENDEIFPSEDVFPILLTAARLNELHAQIILHFVIKTHGKLIERLELPQEYERHVYALTQDMYYSSAKIHGVNLQGSPLHYSELPTSVRKILEVNTLRARRLRPAIEDYLSDYQKNFDM